MTVVAVDAIPFRLPYHQPLRMAAGDIHAAEHVLIRVRDDSGVCGVAEAPARPMFYGESLASIVHAVREWFAPVLVGTDPFAVRALAPSIDRIPANNTAKASLDLALHDLRARLLEQPLFRLLGGTRCPLRVTHMLGHGAPEAVADEAVRMREKYGITAFKIKVGYEPAADVRLVGAVRAALGDEALLYVDANCAYRAEEALAAVLPMVAEYGIAWAEEPTRADDRRGRSRVASRAPVPVLADETVPTLADVTRSLEDGTACWISIKVARTGITQSTDIAAVVRAHGGRVLLGSQGDSGLGTLASLAFASGDPFAAELPGEYSYFLRLADDLVAEPLEIADGHLRAPDAPGSGAVLDEDKLAHYRVD
ncbi:mandelate racemase/muconate lactonizing enzyme family protein [Prauserella flavalba]|uniref:Mandelate racemase/muconate lactonizing enzyme C-terminal domain-containing protein n=1 Tax=Prauserella flavalba TaxID=1477506 RepID=A0A318LCJ4_9PSEU|nr:enolase C-terminal domain-like protein [Prauserella flavalba]PXY21493.1 hypothetical protein BA062_31780 [Prauserella flavalba]